MKKNLSQSCDPPKYSQGGKEVLMGVQQSNSCPEKNSSEDNSSEDEFIVLSLKEDEWAQIIQEEQRPPTPGAESARVFELKIKQLRRNNIESAAPATTSKRRRRGNRGKKSRKLHQLQGEIRNGVVRF